MKQLRPHQDRAIDMLRSSLRMGKRRPILQLPTGAGKTLIAAKIIANAREKGKRVLFVVDALELIDQTVKAFYAEGLHSIGVIQSDHPMTDYSRPIQIASIQTLARREPPPFDLAIVDEAHCRYKAHTDLMERFPVPYIGLSATPWTKGLGLVYDDLIRPASIRELTELGWSAKIKAYAPTHPDLTGVKIKAGEYDEANLSKVMRENKLVADVVETWLRLGDGRPTFVFCVDLAHAEAMQERFQARGIGAGYIDGKTPALERKAVKERLDAGEISVVCSVGALVKGVDWVVGCIVDCQPTRSLMRHVQKLGRMRPNPAWESGIVLDHSDNILRMGLPIDIDRPKLDTTTKGERVAPEAETQRGQKACPKCSSLSPKVERKCPDCGYEGKRFSDIDEGAGVLSEVGGTASGPKKKEPTPQEKEIFYRQLIGWCMTKGKPNRQADGKFKDRFGHWPAKNIGLKPLEPTPETLSWIKASQIRYAKRMERKHAAS